MSRVIRLALEYEGTRYFGFGLQPGLPTIQGVVEQALAPVLGQPVRVTPAGRTDTGVHARGQVLSFRTESPRSTETISRALNAHLPCDVVAGRAIEAELEFDARRSARRRRYRYAIWNGEQPNLWLRRFAWHVRGRLDDERMRAAAALLVGRHDFSSFVGHASQASGDTGSVRTLECLDISRRGELLRFDVVADAFARHMVRNLVGTLTWVGRGRMSGDEVSQVLAARDRRAAGPTAPALGLTLLHVDYGDQESQTE